MTSRSTSLLIFVLALGAVASGCGGGNDQDGSSNASATIANSSITKAEFVKQANAICKKEKAQLLSAVLSYQKKHLNEPSVEVVPNAAHEVIKPELEAQVEEIRSLGAPSGDAAEIEKFFTSLLSGVDQIITKKPPTFSEAERLLQPAGDSARRYGFDRCEYELVNERFNARVLNSS